MARLATHGVTVPLKTGSVKIKTDSGHHIQDFLKKTKRAFENEDELNAFLALREDCHRRRFIAERTPRRAPAMTLEPGIAALAA